MIGPAEHKLVRLHMSQREKLHSAWTSLTLQQLFIYTSLNMNEYN